MMLIRVRSELDKSALGRALDELDALAIRPDAIRSKEEADLALHLAEGAFAKKRNIARKLRYEFILWLSGRRDIRSAMGATAPEGVEFFAAVFSDADERAVLDKLSAKKMPLGLEKQGEPLRLERISLSRIS